MNPCGEIVVLLPSTMSPRQAHGSRYSTASPRPGTQRRNSGANPDHSAYQEARRIHASSGGDSLSKTMTAGFE